MKIDKSEWFFNFIVEQKYGKKIVVYAIFLLF